MRNWIRRYASLYPIGMVAVLAVAGMLILSGFHATLAATNTVSFCTSCHEMRDNNYQEYKKTAHFQNRTGVQAGCPDCHVPKETGPKLLRKLEAASDVWHTALGTINTREKFEAHRMEMAQREWARMKGNDSSACRSCHNFDAMSADDQKPKTYARHMKAKDDHQTCIDCHKGIAHQLPKEFKEDDS